MIEIIATTIEDALRIKQAGADRIELVSALSEGGLTPSYALIKNVIKSVNIPVNVMIRPHSKSFLYTEDEIKLMREDILIAKELNASGVVFGTLNKNNEICTDSLENLLEVCENIDVTFHRAIDEILNPIMGIEILTAYEGITNVLTSGGKGNILNNSYKISNMVSKSKHINILVGGGLNFNNIKEIMSLTKAPQYHFGTAVRAKNSVLGEIEINKLKELISKIYTPGV